jgi:hypothetical protein
MTSRSPVPRPTRGTRRTLRCVALGFILIPAAGAVVAACDSNGTVVSTPIDSGASHDATAADTGSDSGFDASVDAAEEPSEIEASCAVDAGPLDDAEVALGMELVTLHKCQNCHGVALSGNNDGVPSTTAEGGLAYPPNLTSDPATGLGCWTNAQIENAILNGIDNQGMALCNPMPLFGHLGDAGLDPAQAADIVEFLRSLPVVVNNVPDTPSCPVPPPVEAGVDAGVDAAGDAEPDAPTEAAPDAPSDSAPEAAAEGDSGLPGDAAADGATE